MGTRTKKLGTKIDGIIVIVCLCYHCWGANRRIPLFHMSKCFICLNEKKIVNEFTIGYMINTVFNVNKAFREQVETCMYTTFGEITQPFIKATFSKKNTSVLALIIFYDTRAYNPKKYFRALSCVIYNMIKNFVCIDYLYFKSKNEVR